MDYKSYFVLDVSFKLKILPSIANNCASYEMCNNVFALFPINDDVLKVTTSDSIFDIQVVSIHMENCHMIFLSSSQFDRQAT